MRMKVSAGTAAAGAVNTVTTLREEEKHGKRKLPASAQDSASTTTTTTKSQPPKQASTTTTESETARYNYSHSGGRSKLQLQCSDGRVFDVTHEEAMMSSTLWMLLQDVADKKAKTTVKQHMIPIFDVPSNSVELALFYCRCLYKQQVEGIETALHAWDETFLQLDSKTLCDLAKVASHLDIQPLVDLTCRSIAQIMSATEAAHEIRQKFGLEDSPATMECSCELRSGMSGFDFDMFNSLDHDLSTEEYELVEFDQPSVDELVSFINGSGGSRPPPSASSSAAPHQSGKNCHVHATDGGASENGEMGGNAAAKKKNKKKKKKKKATGSNTATPTTTTSTSSPQHNVDKEVASHEDETRNRSHNEHSTSRDKQPAQQLSDDDRAEKDDEGESDSGNSSEESWSCSSLLPHDLHEKMRLARQNPSAIFQESEFEDDEEMEEQIESFRLALESAHLEYTNKVKAKPRVKFAPQDVFRSTLVASQRQTSQRVSATI